ncbi:hypothetical protein [Burkholderia gladioli]|uniref:hypothetical protein n=1 Tax=Burkholderia gladioli TaxID=28095 RepID=UPI0016403941|nr:hypothetical protein [Burkholderia gladioli]MDN7754764.1 hypothetical protein [Burkholderia gladioli]
MLLTTAKQALDLLADAIARTVAARGFNEVCEYALQLGLTGGQTGSLTKLEYRFEGVDESGARVELHVRSYDPSGPFQNIPDINRFTVTLTENGVQTGRYHDEYND